MGKTINLGRGYSAELFRGVKDEKGNEWEAFLLFDGVMAEGFEGTGMFPTAEELVVYLKEVVVPQYITDNKIGAIRGLTSSSERFELVKTYILANKICYGATVDTIEVMESFGYMLPKVEDEKFDAFEYIEYLKLAGKLANEFVNQFNSFGFCSDKNNKNTKFHPVKKPMKFGNLVYTRFPWTAGYKGEKAVAIGLAALKVDHLSGVDLARLAKDDAELAGALMSSNKAKLDDAVVATKIFSENFEERMATFKECAVGGEDARVNRYREVQPARYGQYD